MNVEIAPSDGELKVTVINHGIDISYTTIEGRTKFELPSRDSVISIEVMKMGAEPKSDPQLSFNFIPQSG